MRRKEERKEEVEKERDEIKVSKSLIDASRNELRFRL